MLLAKGKAVVALSSKESRSLPLSIISVLVLAFITLFNTFRSVRNLVSVTFHATVAPVVSEGALGDGCFHVFIDAGSNRGVHGRFLFEPQKYNQSTFVKIFDEIYGPNREMQNICVFAFEPNPFHNKSQSTTQAAYRRMGWRYHYMPYGVSHRTGKLTFYRNYDYQGGDKKEEWGFGISLQGKPNEDQEVVVDIIDLSDWAERNIFNREIPPPNSFNHGPSVVAMKMDVEGSEYGTLEHLLETGTGYKFDHILGEFHPYFFPQVVKGQNYTSKDELLKLQNDLIERLQEKNGPGFRYFDDEQYLHDGMPYPTPHEIN